MIQNDSHDMARGRGFSSAVIYLPEKINQDICSRPNFNIPEPLHAYSPQSKPYSLQLRQKKTLKCRLDPPVKQAGKL